MVSTCPPLTETTTGRYPWQTAFLPRDVASLRSETVRADQPVRLRDGTMRPYVNLDNAASTPAVRCVRHKVDELLHRHSSVHRGTGLKSLLCIQV